MAEDMDKVKKRMQELEQLSAPRELSTSEKFAAALTGFLPLIAGLGSSEDMAATSQVGLAGLKEINNQKQQEDALKRANALEAFKSVGKEGSQDLREQEIELRKEGRDLRKQSLEILESKEARLSKGQVHKEQEQELNRDERIIKAFNADKLVLKYKDALDAADTVEQLIAKNSPLTEAFAKRALARLSGEVGVLTDQDVNAFGGSRALISRFNQAVTTAATGKITEENKKHILEIVALLKRIKNAKLKSRSKELSSQYGQVDKSPEHVQKLLTPNQENPEVKRKVLDPKAEALLLKRKAAQNSKAK